MYWPFWRNGINSDLIGRINGLPFGAAFRVINCGPAWREVAFNSRGFVMPTNHPLPRIWGVASNAPPALKPRLLHQNHDRSWLHQVGRSNNLHFVAWYTDVMW